MLTTTCFRGDVYCYTCVCVFHVVKIRDLDGETKFFYSAVHIFFIEILKWYLD